MTAALTRLARSPGLPVCLATFAIYAALVPWMVRVWARSGDEPHYLLAAHSLVTDGDLDLNNNYAERDYAPFYSEYFLNPHVLIRADGSGVLTHNLGLSFLIAPAYALGGYAGVLYALAALGALLAANVYLLGYELTGNWLAAAVGWAGAAFTPPLLWYVFLVYPEMIAALVVVVALRHLLRPAAPRTPGPYTAMAIGLGLSLLPWLSSRFLPIFAWLLAWAAWRAVADRRRTWALAGGLAVAGLLAYMAFSFWLYGNASPAAAYAGPIPLAVERSFALLRAARGLVGWLVDNQRGVLITAPIYAAALWGCAWLAWRQPRAGLAVLAPLAVTLLPVAVVGGFWTGWEYSARFLVIALPPLGAGLAYLWAAGRRAVVAPITLALLGLSLISGAVVVEQPLRGLISSPVEWLKPHADVEALVPAMARYAFIPAGTEAAAGAPIADAALPDAAAQAASGLDAVTWEVPAGQSGIVLRQVDLPEFTFGWYTARLPLQAPGAAPDTPIARIRIFSPSGGEYFARTVYARDLPTTGAFTFGFRSPLYNGWGFPPTILVSSTGQSLLRLGLLRIEPDRFHSLGLAAIWLGALGLLGVLVTRGAGEPRPRPLIPAPALTVALALAATGSLAWSLLPQPRSYHTAEVQRTTGSAVEDARAYQGRAMQADPALGDEPGRLAATPAEIFGAGPHKVTVSAAGLGPPPPDPAAPGLSLRVLGSDAEALAMRWDIPAGDLPRDGQYGTFTFNFDNPRQQALTFILDYTGAAALRADRITVQPSQ